MPASTKLSASVKALCYLAQTFPEPKSSSEIAEHIGSNASKLRRLLSLMSKDKLVESTKGTTGGFLLKKNPKDLHLQEIYCAIEDRKAFHLDIHRSTNGTKNLSSQFNGYFFDLFSDIQVDIENKMKKITLLSIMKELKIKSSYK